MELYIKDTVHGGIRRLGTRGHDTLYVDDNGCINYMDWQCQEGTGPGGAFVFCDAEGNPLKEHDHEYNIIAMGEECDPFTDGKSTERDRALDIVREVLDRYRCMEHETYYVSSMVSDLENIIEKLEDKNDRL